MSNRSHSDIDLTALEDTPSPTTKSPTNDACVTSVRNPRLAFLNDGSPISIITYADTLGNFVSESSSANSDSDGDDVVQKIWKSIPRKVKKRQMKEAEGAPARKIWGVESNTPNARSDSVDRPQRVSTNVPARASATRGILGSQPSTSNARDNMAIGNRPDSTNRPHRSTNVPQIVAGTSRNGILGSQPSTSNVRNNRPIGDPRGSISRRDSINRTQTVATNVVTTTATPQRTFIKRPQVADVVARTVTRRVNQGGNVESTPVIVDEQGPFVKQSQFTEVVARMVARRSNQVGTPPRPMADGSFTESAFPRIESPDISGPTREYDRVHEYPYDNEWNQLCATAKLFDEKRSDAKNCSRLSQNTARPSTAANERYSTKKSVYSQNPTLLNPREHFLWLLNKKTASDGISNTNTGEMLMNYVRTLKNIQQEADQLAHEGVRKMFALEREAEMKYVCGPNDNLDELLKESYGDVNRTIWPLSSKSMLWLRDAKKMKEDAEKLFKRDEFYDMIYDVAKDLVEDLKADDIRQEYHWYSTIIPDFASLIKEVDVEMEAERAVLDKREARKAAAAAGIAANPSESMLLRTGFKTPPNLK